MTTMMARPRLQPLGQENPPPRAWGCQRIDLLPVVNLFVRIAAERRAFRGWTELLLPLLSPVRVARRFFLAHTHSKQYGVHSSTAPGTLLFLIRHISLQTSHWY